MTSRMDDTHHPDDPCPRPASGAPLRSWLALAACLPALVSGVASPGSAAAQGPSFTIRTNDGVITRIGTLRIFGRDAGTLARASAVFGRPSRVDPIGDGSDACRVAWRRLRLNATFANFGIDSACSPQGGRLQAATIRSPRFRTTRGVRVGTASSSIPIRHSSAQFVNGAWWIASTTPPFSDEEEIATISAIVGGGRVRALKLWVGGAGD
jgi:hypothetical protein